MSKMFKDQKKEHEKAMRKQKARQKSSKPARGR
jgi:hypothetical protein